MLREQRVYMLFEMFLRGLFTGFAWWCWDYMVLTKLGVYIKDQETYIVRTC
jgi:hypothetical protein